MKPLFLFLLLTISTNLLYGQCVPSLLELDYDLDTLALGDTVLVTWNSDCESAVMNISLGSLPPLPFQVQQVDNGIANTGSRSFVIDTNLALGEYLFYIEDEEQNIWDYGDTFRIVSEVQECDFPSVLDLTYELDAQQAGDTVDVTWAADCEQATMNVALVSLPPLSYEVQQIEYDVANTGKLSFILDGNLAPGDYQFYIEDEEQNIWTYGDTFQIFPNDQGCRYPSVLDLTYSFDVQETGDTLTVTWDADCGAAIMNISLVSLPPLPYQVQQVDNGVANNGSREFVLDSDLEPGDYQFYIEDEGQNIWDYGDTFLINAMTTSISEVVLVNSVFYNPSSSLIMWKGFRSATHFVLFDPLGRVVLRRKSDDGFIDVSHLRRGTYFVRGSDGTLLKFIR